MSDKKQIHAVRIKRNQDEASRREMFDGQMHTVVPAVLAVDGVMNGARVSSEELSRSVEAWNGRPIPILHPEQMGMPVSVAATPQIMEQAVGFVFGAQVEDQRLKAELWLNEKKVDALGHSGMLAAMSQGEMIEVSTAYFADDVIEAGEYRGKPYELRHVNLRPDHLALLPGDIGACSIEDGCGAPRANQLEKPETGTMTKVNSQTKRAINSLLKALGVTPQTCDCEDDDVKLNRDELLKKAKALHANKGITAEQLEMLQNADDDQLDMMAAVLGHLAATNAPDDNMDPDDIDDNLDGDANNNAAKANAADKAKAEKAKANAAAVEPGQVVVNEADLQKMIDDGVRGTLKRNSLIDRLVANEGCPFDADELEGMQTGQLVKLEAKFGSDYSANAHVHNGGSNDPAPLGLPAGVLAPRAN